MAKYFFAKTQRSGSTVTLDGETAHHLLHVLRMTPGESLTLCDGAKTDCAALITEAYPKKPQVVCEITSSSPALTEPKTKITLYQGLPKGDKLEWIIQKCVELGVHRIVPVATSRSVARIKNDAKKALRHQRIAQSAAEQSMRGIIPKVSEAMTFDGALAQMDASACTLVPYEGEQTTTLKAALPQAQNINLWIGPEGGFSQEEIQALTEAGAVAVTLGPRILRTETAAIAAVAQTLCLTE
ncbi:MAG: 16S rRNA (uracil(1498)-N(3))-methyltransferase [Defluviitaleaceae bacterium]|nr:16S rRNA (uracil(1498)-N(3))-methyltransferase [Defluviitaleaceae bacterium]